MSISVIFNPKYGYDTFKLLGVPAELLQAAAMAGVVIKTTGIGIFEVQLGAMKIGGMTLKASTVSLLKSGTLGPASCQHFKNIAVKFLTDALGQDPLPLPVPVPVEEPKLGPSIVSEATDVFGPILQGALKVTPQKLTSPGPLTPAFAVPLSEATVCHQAVKGSSSGSVYYTFAIFPGLKMAARLKGLSLSLRAEGPGLSNFEAGFSSLGMDLKSNYASGHYTLVDKSLFVKTLGAAAAVVGVWNATSLANFDNLLKESA